MSQRNRSTGPVQLAGISLIAALCLLAAYRTWRGNEERPQVKKIRHNLSVQLIQQYAAVPGKLIEATEAGDRTRTYRCSAEDAAVAVVRVTDSVPGFVPTTLFGTPKDPEGHQYFVNPSAYGNLYFLTIVRGFSKRPKSISIPVRIYVGALRSEPDATFSIAITQIAEPIRVVFPPSPTQTRALAKFAKAEAINGGVYVTMKAKTAKPGFYAPQVLSTSFCPSQQVGSPTYQPDAVKARIDEYRTDATEYTLIYKNAQVHDFDGKRVLVLPTAQTVGKIAGADASVDALPATKYHSGHLAHSLGFVSVRVPELPVSPSALYKPRASLVRMSPSPEQMGLDFVQLQVPAMEFTEMVKARAGALKWSPEVIPEIKLVFKIMTDTKVGSRVVVLPVSRATKQPKPSPRIGVLAGPGGGGGPRLSMGGAVPAANPMLRNLPHH